MFIERGRWKGIGDVVERLLILFVVHLIFIHSRRRDAGQDAREAWEDVVRQDADFFLLMKFTNYVPYWQP